MMENRFLLEVVHLATVFRVCWNGVPQQYGDLAGHYNNIGRREPSSDHWYVCEGIATVSSRQCRELTREPWEFIPI